MRDSFLLWKEWLKGKKSKLRFQRKTVVALGLFTIATLVLFLLEPGYYLTLEDTESGQVYEAFPVHEGDTFSIGFVHSVNKSPVIDCYEIKEHSIYVEKTVYYGFGAGVQTQLEEGESLTYGEDGSMIVSGFDRRMDGLAYFVGTVSDHILEIGGEKFSLSELCGKNSRVSFQVRFYICKDAEINKKRKEDSVWKRQGETYRRRFRKNWMRL